MMRARAFVTHKANESFNDCHDRFCINPATGSVAVCDGMSQSLFPKYWAEIIAGRYTSQRDWKPTRENLKELSSLWRFKVYNRIAEMKSQGISTWRVENMLADGLSAGATLVGIRIDGSNWSCDVLGDSCMIILEGYRIKEIYSSMDTEQFDSYPDYYDSDPLKGGKGELRTLSGTLPVSDLYHRILLVTDAIGEFLSKLRGSKNEETFIRDLLNVESSGEFEILVEWWRQNGMHNDDTTLVILSFEKSDAEPFKIQEEWVW